MMQHVRPGLVSIDRAAITYPDPGSGYLTTDLGGGSAVRTYHDFGDLSESGTLGDPSLASPEAGAEFFEAVTGELVRFIEDFARWPVPPARAASQP
jgi:creatinine amidohydrolase